MIAKIEDCDDVGVGAESTHGLRLAGDARAGDLVQALSLDQGEGYLPVQKGVVGQVDLFLPTLAQEHWTW